MIHFISIEVQEKSQNEDYRAFLTFEDSKTMTVYQIRGYGDTPGKAADYAYASYQSEDRYDLVTDSWESE
jgi:hypothetical protein